MRRGLPRRLALLAGTAALLGCVGDGAPADAGVPLARLEVEMLGGFRQPALPPPPAHVALLIDARAPMSRRSAPGVSALSAARASAIRLLATLPPDTDVDARALGAARDATCASPPQRLIAGSQAELLGQLAALRPSGKGSLSRALEQLAEEDFERAVAFTTLESGCPEDLCTAARHLAERDVRLELVLIGAATPPECLARIARPDSGEPLLAETLRSVPYCVRTLGPDAAIHACSETGGLPVVVPDERVQVDVDLDPPLRLERRFAPGTRWRLQVLDFPATDPPERQWRWLRVSDTTPPEPEPAATPEAQPAPEEGEE